MYKSETSMLEEVRNKTVDELFRQAREDVAVTSDFRDLFD